MRAAVYLALVAAAVAATARGELRPALALACVKATLVGLSYMELHRAHPAHRAGFVAGAALLTALLAWVA